MDARLLPFKNEQEAKLYLLKCLSDIGNGAQKKRPAPVKETGVKCSRCGGEFPPGACEWTLSPNYSTQKKIKSPVIWTCKNCAVQL